MVQTDTRTGGPQRVAPEPVSLDTTTAPSGTAPRGIETMLAGAARAVAVTGALMFAGTPFSTNAAVTAPTASAGRQEPGRAQAPGPEPEQTVGKTGDRLNLGDSQGLEALKAVSRALGKAGAIPDSVSPEDFLEVYEGPLNPQLLEEKFANARQGGAVPVLNMEGVQIGSVNVRELAKEASKVGLELLGVVSSDFGEKEVVLFAKHGDSYHAIPLTLGGLPKGEFPTPAFVREIEETLKQQSEALGQRLIAGLEPTALPEHLLTVPMATVGNVRIGQEVIYEGTPRHDELVRARQQEKAGIGYIPQDGQRDLHPSGAPTSPNGVYEGRLLFFNHERLPHTGFSIPERAAKSLRQDARKAGFELVEYGPIDYPASEFQLTVERDGVRGHVLFTLSDGANDPASVVDALRTVVKNLGSVK